MFTARSSPTTSSAEVPERVVPVDAPSVRVHAGRLDRQARRVELTPSQALELAREGTEAVRRRQRPTAG
jgi:hypothetical protein